MKSILITGATGNIGTEVIRFLCGSKPDSEIIAAVRNPDTAKAELAKYPDLSFRHFDFENRETFGSAFQDIDILFLLRPPHISEIKEVFGPLLESARKHGINKIVFLSVQGAEKSKVIPHNKLERLIKEFGFEHIFVRPSYFMQNLTTTLLPEIREKHSLSLPSKNAKFNWIDVRNIGEACAELITSFEKYKNRAFEITGTENMSFPEVTDLMSRVLGMKIEYRSMNPLSFYFRKRKEGLKSDFAIVMTLLHFLPHLQKEPEISLNYKMLTSKEPTKLKEFIQREKEVFLQGK
jgi:uncharacterized protein YbjT (DUF2867 family)